MTDDLKQPGEGEAGGGQSHAGARGPAVFLLGLGVLVLVVLAIVGAQQLSGRSRSGSHKPAPQLVGEEFGGKTFQLSELRGKVVMLDFWASWCGPCKEEMPVLVRLAREYQDRGLVFVAADRIDTDAPWQVTGFMEHLKPLPTTMRVPWVRDEWFEAYRIEALPTLFFISADGRILGSHRGAGSEREMKRWIDDALEEGKP